MVPTRKQHSRGTYKRINGVWCKLCTGQAHDEPEYLPATEKYFYILKKGPRAGKPVARCRLCHNWSKLKSPGSHHGLVPVATVFPFYLEVVNRIGMAELYRRSGLSFGHVNGVLTHKLKHVKKAQARRLMLELVTIQRNNEYSIDARSKWRAERRNHSGYDICPGCGTPKTNFTRNCESCKDRLYDMMRKGKITRRAYNLKGKELFDYEG